MNANTPAERIWTRTNTGKTFHAFVAGTALCRKGLTEGTGQLVTDLAGAQKRVASMSGRVMGLSVCTRCVTKAQAMWDRAEASMGPATEAHDLGYVAETAETDMYPAGTRVVTATGVLGTVQAENRGYCQVANHPNYGKPFVSVKTDGGVYRRLYMEELAVACIGQKDEFPAGTRVRLLDRPSAPAGTVKGITSHGDVEVLWDGLTQSLYYYPSELTAAETAQADMYPAGTRVRLLGRPNAPAGTVQGTTSHGDVAVLRDGFSKPLYYGPSELAIVTTADQVAMDQAHAEALAKYEADGDAIDRAITQAEQSLLPGANILWRYSADRTCITGMFRGTVDGYVTAPDHDAARREIIRARSDEGFRLWNLRITPA